MIGQNWLNIRISAVRADHNNFFPQGDQGPKVSSCLHYFDWLIFID